MTKLILKRENDYYIEHKDQISLNETIEDLNEIQKNLAEYINYQKDPLLKIEDNIEKANQYIENGKKDLEIANSYYTNYKSIFIGGLLGTLTLSPLGVLLGVKVGSSLTIGGALVGGYTGYKIQKV